MKVCPFKNTACEDSCALYITPEEMNELVYNRLKSIGVIAKEGTCSLKNIALAKSREIFENTKAFRD